MNQGFVADTLYLLGQVAFYEDRLDEATERLNECRYLGGDAEHPWLETRALFVLGQVAMRRKEHAAALALIQESLAQYQEVRPQIPALLEGLAQVCLGLGQAKRAGSLFGAASRLRTVMRSPVFPVDRPGYDQTLAELEATLGADAFASAWTAGEAMSAQESVAYALATRHT